MWRCGVLALWTRALLANGECTDDLGCVTRCYGAPAGFGNISCFLSTCSDAWERCLCFPNHAALRTDGGCDGPLATSSPTCEVEYSILASTGMWASPEFTVEDMLAGRPSDAMTVMLRKAVAEAIGQPMETVALQNITIVSTRYVGSPGDVSVPTLLHFDLAFTFCSTAGVGRLHPRHFENGLGVSLGDYEAFRASTVRLLEFDQIARPSASQDTSTTTAAPPAAENVHDMDGGEDVRSIFSDYWWLSWLVLGLLLMVSILIVVYCRLRRRKGHLSTSPFAGLIGRENLSGPRMSARARSLDELDSEDVIDVTLGSVVEDFDGSHLAEDFERFGQRPLAIKRGEVVEVIASTGGWLYGNVLGVPERHGCFPENSIAWMGRPLSPHIPMEDSLPDSLAAAGAVDGTPASTPGVAPADSEAATADTVAANENPNREFQPPPRSRFAPASEAAREAAVQQGFVATAKETFSPEEVQDAGPLNGELLSLQKGDVIKVLAGSGGWLYGMIVGVSEKGGYFPENRVDWLSRPEDAA